MTWILMAAVTAWAGQTNCNARLTQRELFHAMSAYQVELALLTRNYVDVRVAIAWGEDPNAAMKKVFDENWSSNRTVFPTYPPPTAPSNSDAFVVAVRGDVKDSDPEFISYDYHVQQYDVRYASLGFVEAVALVTEFDEQPVMPATLINLFSALATLPSALALILEGPTPALAAPEPPLIQELKKRPNAFTPIGGKESLRDGKPVTRYYFKILRR